MFGLTLPRSAGLGLGFQNSACGFGQFTSLASRFFCFFECLTQLFVFGFGKPDALTGEFGLVMCFGSSQNELTGFSFASGPPGITAFHMGFRFYIDVSMGMML